MFSLFSPIPFIGRNRNTGILGNIRPRERHKILVVHLKSLDNIFDSKPVGILIAHIVKNFHKPVRITPQLIFVNTTLHSINRQHHNTIEPVTNVDLRLDLSEPPIIQIPLYRPTSASFAAKIPTGRSSFWRPSGVLSSWHQKPLSRSVSLNALQRSMLHCITEGLCTKA